MDQQASKLGYQSFCYRQKKMFSHGCIVENIFYHIWWINLSNGFFTHHKDQGYIQLNHAVWYKYIDRKEGVNVKFIDWRQPTAIAKAEHINLYIHNTKICFDFSVVGKLEWSSWCNHLFILHSTAATCNVSINLRY